VKLRLFFIPDNHSCYLPAQKQVACLHGRGYTPCHGDFTCQLLILPATHVAVIFHQIIKGKEMKVKSITMEEAE
jgi:hypothetical protein